MEWFWILAAAAGAGIGTGLAGLSAATVMVPVLIVLCPSFAGETGAYQATAIALASDILSSAAAAVTYARHGNIDMKRGSVMAACILTMCAVGSWAAYLAGNVVLGGFSLFLTFCIGIRFLVKPDASRRNSGEDGARAGGLGWRGIAVSLFFGLTIGFGTGFVGTGGGMMMLIVFTVFLGMGLKEAVGTSTCIMTFTALIASAAHILIHPAILLEKWDVMLVSIVTATVFSLLSARFANRVPGRVVGLTAGVCLTLLGGAMIILQYRDFFASRAVADLARGTLLTLGRYAVYIGSLAAGLILLYFLFRIPKDVFRKLLHVAAFTSSIFIVLRGEGWLAETLTLALFALIVWPILALAERWRGYGALFVEKKPGEVKNSLLLLFLSQAALCALACGFLKKPWILIAATASWGLGDIAAAWVGRPLGKHKIRLRFADPAKSWEGSAAMAAVSFTACLVSLLLLSVCPLPKALLWSALTGIVSSAAEMCSRGGWDTVTVPAADALVLWILALVSLP